MTVLLMTVLVVVYMFHAKVGALLLILASAYYLFFKKGTIYEKLLRITVFSAPYYNFSFWGSRQRFSVCIVSSAILCVLLTFSWLRRKPQCNSQTVYRCFLFLVFLTFYAISIIFTQAPVETFFITYQLIVLAYLIVIIPACRNRELNNIDTDELVKMFIAGTCSLVIALYIQYVADMRGIPLGEIYRYKTGRSIYNLFFYAKSVLSMYISIGLLYFFIDYINRKKITDIIWMIAFVGAILINNSRTGLASFAVSAMLYCVMHSKKIFGSIRVTAILILAASVGLYVIQFMLESRTNLTGFTDDNGRLDAIVNAIKIMPNYLFSGIGGSAADYQKTSLEITSHNFFIAYLVQFGLLGGLAVNTLLLAPLFSQKKNNWFYLCCIITGGMLFANWHNCAFILPVYIFALLDKRKTNAVSQKRIQ